MQQLAAKVLPAGFSYEWTTLAFQQIRAGNTAIFAFALGVVFVFLVLAAQFESLTLPLAVILIVPMCLVASIVGVVLRGQDNNILTQVGFIVLDRARRQERDSDRRIRQAAGRPRPATATTRRVEAARLRLRPILMTSLAFILGVSPLVWAIGAGAELRQVARHRGVLRHDRRHRLRLDLHAGFLCGVALAGRRVLAQQAAR